MHVLDDEQVRPALGGRGQPVDQSVEGLVEERARCRLDVTALDAGDVSAGSRGVRAERGKQRRLADACGAMHEHHRRSVFAET